MSQTRLMSPASSAYAYPLLIKSLLTSPLRRAPEQEIVYRDQLRYSYRELNARIGRLGNALRALGVGPGDVVAVLDWDSHRYLEAFFAVPMLGAVLHTVNIRLSPEQILYTMQHAEDSVVLVHADFLALAAGICPQLPLVKSLILLQDTPDQAAEPDPALPLVGEYEALLAAQPSECEFPDFDENSLASTFYTTGTTGLPKAVAFSHRQLVLHTLGGCAALGALDGPGRFRADDVYMPITPMFHVHAWGLPFMATMLGVKQVYPGRYEPEVLMKLLLQEKVTFSHCVPTILHLLVSSPAARQVDLSNWKVIIGGSALPRGLALAALELGIDVYVGYGMSETCPILSLARVTPEQLRLPLPEQVDARIRTGMPIPLVELRVLDADGKQVPADGHSPGEIQVRTPWLTQGYLKDPESSEKLWEGGWLHTGDVAVLCPDGQLQITDRIKDVIKSGGEWISSLELESLLSRHPAVSEAAVVGLPDAQWGERPHALVVLKTDTSATPEELCAHLRGFVEAGHIQGWAIPKDLRLVSAIPKTSVGKLDKKRIRAEWNESKS
ncbi:MAG: fatty acid--CoA ligase [Candidatus Sericytochromatia bacterium]